MMDYMFSSTPKKSASLKQPGLQIQTNVIPELYLCSSNRLQTDRETNRHDPRGDDSFGLSHLDHSGKVQHFISEDRTEISSKRCIRQPDKDMYRSQDTENTGTISKMRLKQHGHKFTRSTPAVNITVQPPFLGQIHLTNFGSLSCVNSDYTDSSDHCPLDSSDLSSPDHLSTHSRSGFLNNCPRPERCFEDDISCTDSSHRSLQDMLYSRESGYHSISFPYQQHQHKTPDLHSNLTLPHLHSHIGIDSSYGCPLEQTNYEVCHQKQEKSTYPVHVKKKKDYKNRQQQQTNILTNLPKSQTSAERAIRLIDLLYHTDPTNCYNNIILARWFKQWHNNVQKIVSKRQAYSHKLYQAHSIERTVMIKKYLALWREQYQAKLNMAKAADLCQFHLARKAVRALKWALWRGIREQEAAISTRITGLTRRHFSLWKQKFDRRKEARWQLKFSSWQRDSELRIRCHQFEHEYRERVVVCKAFSVWKTAMIEAVMCRKADNHYRSHVFREVVHNWCLITANRRVRKLQKRLTRKMNERRVMIPVFYRWHMLFMDCQDAKAFNRGMLLTKSWRLWRTRYSDFVTHLKKSVAVADQFRSLSLCLTTLNTWKRRLLEVKVQHIYKLKTMRNCWLLWKQHFLIKSYRRAQSERLQKLNVLLKLKLNAQLLKQSRTAVCHVIDSVLARKVFHRWRRYCQSRKEERFAVKRQERLLKIEGLKRLEQEMKMISSYLKLKWAYIHWLHRKQIKEANDEAMVRAFFTELETRQKRCIWTAWTNLTQRSLGIKSFIVSVKRRQLYQAFTGWRRVVVRKKKFLGHLKYQAVQTTTTAFLTWRILFLSRVQTRECEKIWSKTLLKTFFHRWVSQFNLRNLSATFRRKMLLKRAFVTWTADFHHRLQIQLEIDESRRLSEMRKCFSRLQMYKVGQRKKRELSFSGWERHDHYLKRKALSRWKYSLGEKRLIFQHITSKAKNNSDFPLIRTGQEIQTRVLMNSLRRSWDTWVQLFIKTRVCRLFLADKLCERYFHTWITNVKNQAEVESKRTEKIYRTRQMRNAFEKWQLRLIGLEDHHLKLKLYLYYRTTPILRHYWELWKKFLSQNINKRKVELSVQMKAFDGWRKWSSEKSDRVMRCRALQRAIQDRRTKHLFEFWKRRYFSQRLLVSYEDGLLMTRSFNTWNDMVAHLNLLERLSSMFVSTQGKTLTWKTLMIWRDSLHRNQILSQSRWLMEHQTKIHMKRAIFLRWKQKWLLVIAGNHNNAAQIKRYFNKWKSHMDSTRSKY
ncbi:uncharacterized protein LOC135474926 [Liolophura sinensis]|uniref:uncharacterized protein LOC135474926 n=1 Tax=Liolophura sinensis TaxID=3198878 RepID=UPI003159232A